MQRLIAGVQRFQSEVFPKKRELFQRLAAGQRPEVLFITCADSRIDPHLITQSEPGDIFVARNAGNIVPPEGSVRASEAASVEFAVKALGVRFIIVCGHNGCGAMKALMEPESVKELPAVADWLTHAEAAWRETQSIGAALDPEEQLRVLVEQNVLAQCRNLMTHSAVAEAVAAGRLELHAWVHDIETGRVLRQDATNGSFVSLT